MVVNGDDRRLEPVPEAPLSIRTLDRPCRAPQALALDRASFGRVFASVALIASRLPARSSDGPRQPPGPWLRERCHQAGGRRLSMPAARSQATSFGCLARHSTVWLSNRQPGRRAGGVVGRSKPAKRPDTIEAAAWASRTGRFAWRAVPLSCAAMGAMQTPSGAVGFDAA